MLPCCCSLPSSSTSVNKFISDNLHITMLEKRCSTMKDLKIIHAQLIKTGLIKDKIAASRVLAFCASPAGNMNYAYLIFTRIQSPNLYAWNTIIRGFSQSSTPETVQLFSELEKSYLIPDSISFIGVLTACHHLGLVDEAKGYFSLMTTKYKFTPSLKHYNCMVNVLGQAGLIEEAEGLIKEMPVEPDAVIWGSLLSACRKHGNVEIAKLAARQLNHSNPRESSGHVLMSKIHAALGQFEDAVTERVQMRKKLIEKEIGCSLIEVDGYVHEFIAGARTHQEIQEIYSLLNGKE